MESLFWFVVLIGILIFAHEGGHFLFAKLFKVKVLTFSLGFGGPIRLGRFKLSFKLGETEYRIAWFPVGGFVKMLGEDPTQEVSAEEMQRSFSNQRAWKRFLIVFAGPLFSVLLAVPIYFVFHVVQSKARAPLVGYVVGGTPAERAGLKAGDTVLKVGGQPVATWDQVDSAVQDLGGKPGEVEVDRQGQVLRFTVAPEREFDESGLELLGERWDLGLRNDRQGNIVGIVGPNSPAAQAGIESWDKVLAVGGVAVSDWAEIERLMAANGPQLLPVTVLRAAKISLGAITVHAPVLFDVVIRPLLPEAAPPLAFRTATAYHGFEPIDLYVLDVAKGQPAEKNGVIPGDKIVSMFGQPVRSWEQFSRLIHENAEANIPMQVRHQGELREISFVPGVIEQTNEFKQTTQKRGFGVTYQSNFYSGRRIPRPDRLVHALGMSFEETGRAISMNVLGFVRIFQGRVAASEAIGGPIMILNVAGKTAKKGWDSFLTMMAFMSVLLGLLNLLPIPILDGGHLTFILIEVLRRRPLSIHARVVASYVGLVLLVALMVFAFGNDIHRYWSDFTSIFG